MLHLNLAQTNILQPIKLELGLQETLQHKIGAIRLILHILCPKEQYDKRSVAKSSISKDINNQAQPVMLICQVLEAYGEHPKHDVKPNSGDVQGGGDQNNA
jgi:hypothetical protein